MKILILGASGMLGNTMLRVLSAGTGLDVFATARSVASLRFFEPKVAEKILCGVDVENQDALVRLLGEVKPDVVVNCIGLIKQLAEAGDPLVALPINAMLPHRLSHLCQLIGARLIHISTDCVFSGEKGDYRETDTSDAKDLYGKSKFIGEVAYPHTITLRTSIIGHELVGRKGLLGWFLGQEGQTKGYTRAIFSGLPTVELARVVRDVVLPRENLFGIYHVAADPIAKFDLLNMIAKTYNKSIKIIPDESVVIDRSLNASLFRETTGYVAPSWPELIQHMFEFK
ncbi:MAG: SDR family oxidoreductase [Alphaproteobacteria bacterium]|nr:SDR family oxidoreductase [Alphaproteobacteria bacterium]